jgi:hypothetical protein
MLMKENKETLAQYASQFELIQDVSFSHLSLRIDFSVTSEQKFIFGYQPYFNVEKNWTLNDTMHTINIESSLKNRTVISDENSPGLCVEVVSDDQYDSTENCFHLSGYVQYSFGPLS